MTNALDIPKLKTRRLRCGALTTEDCSTVQYLGSGHEVLPASRRISFGLGVVASVGTVLILVVVLALPLPAFAAGLDLNKINWHDSSGQTVDLGNQELGETELEESRSSDGIPPTRVPLALLEECETEDIEHLNLVDTDFRRVLIEAANEICNVYELAAYELTVVEQLPLTRESVRARHKIEMILVDIASKYRRFQDEIPKFGLHAIDQRIGSGNDLILSMDNEIGSKLMKAESLLNYLELSSDEFNEIRIERPVHR